MGYRWHKWICAGLLMTAICLTGVGTAADVPTSSSFLMGDRLYEMYVNDEPVGVFSHASTGLLLYDEMVAEKLKSYEDSAFLDNTVYFRETANKAISSEESVRAALDARLVVKVKAWAINIDGEPVLYVPTDEDAQSILDAVQAPYRERVQHKGSQLTGIGFKENVTLEKLSIPYNQLTTDMEYAANLLATGLATTETYTVASGDDLYGIAQRHEMTLHELQLANPELDMDEPIHPGQELLLTAVSPMITVLTEETFTFEEEIPFDIVTRNDNTIYKGQTKLVQTGREGIRQVTVNIRSENGKETARDTVGQEVLKAAVNEIKAVGTLDPPPVESVTRGDYTALSRSGVQMTPWFDSAQYTFPRGAIAKVTHVDSGVTFWVKRRGGTYHADCEPLTANDTAQMKKIYGSWSWDRKSVIVQVEGSSVRMAGSMNGMPHGGSSIDNNFSGHFCIHFLGSYTHVAGSQCPLHQACIRHAAGLE